MLQVTAVKIFPFDTLLLGDMQQQHCYCLQAISCHDGCALDRICEILKHFKYAVISSFKAHAGLLCIEI